MLTRKKQFAIVLEGEAGAAETPTDTNLVFEVEELNADFNVEFNERNLMRTSLSKLAPVPGLKVGRHTGLAELIGSGSTTTEPPINPLLLALGTIKRTVNTVDLDVGGVTGTFRPGEKFTAAGGAVGRFVALDDATTMRYAAISGTVGAAEALTGAVSGATVTTHATENLTPVGFAYMPQDPDSSSTYTCWVLEDGNKKPIYGARGTAVIQAEAGGIGKLNFTLDGAGTTPSAETLFAGANLPTITPATFLSASLTLHQVGSDTAADAGDAVCVQRFELDLGNTVVRDVCANQADGIKTFRITERNPVIRINPEGSVESAIAYFTKYAAGTQFAFVCDIGTTATQRFKIIAPSCTYAGLPTGDREGILTYDAELTLRGSDSAGDDEYMIVAH